MKPLILSFFTVILIYSLFFDHDEQKEHEYQLGLDSSMNLDKKFQEHHPADSVNFLAAHNKKV